MIMTSSWAMSLVIQRHIYHSRFVEINLTSGFLILVLFSLEQTIGSLQKKYSIGSFELLSKTAPIQALSLLLLGPFVDYSLSGKFITTYKMSSGALVRTYPFPIAAF